MKDANDEWIKEQCIIIYNEMTAGGSEKAYSIIKTLEKTSQAKASVVTDTGFPDRECRSPKYDWWIDYSSYRVNYPHHPDSSLLQNDPSSEPVFTNPFLDLRIKNRLGTEKNTLNV